jgi:hypothetical protein
MVIRELRAALVECCTVSDRRVIVVFNYYILAVVRFVASGLVLVP